MNEPAQNRPTSQHPLLADRARLEKITSNMDLTIQRIIYGRVYGKDDERLLCGGMSRKDVLQEALLALLRVDPNSLSGTWEALSVTVAKRRAIDAVRQSVKGRRAPDSAEDAPDEINIVEFDPGLSEHHPAAATADDPEHEFMLNEQQKVLLRLARELPERERTIFNALHFQDRKRVDVGKDVELTPQRVGQIYGETLLKLWKRARSDPAFPSEVDWKEHA